MAVEAYFGAKTVWCAEYDKHASQIIKDKLGHLNYGDLTKIDWITVEPIDILTAGYPCQPFSVAGNRQGSNDARHLWPYIKQAICTLRPEWVVLENVRGHLSLGFKEVLKDLAQLGYDARWQIVRASDVGAPHQRARLFIVAYPNGSRCQGCAEASDRLEQDSLPFTDPYSDACEKSRRTFAGVSGSGTKVFDRSNRKVNWSCHSITEREVPPPLDQDKLNPAFIEYMMGLPKGWVTNSNLARTNQLKMLGNGVVPQQAYYALELLLK
jgi:DNA (cytosine-5)-methyltransferase 1